MEFTKRILAQDRVRILGICFGHQIVGRALGTKVGPNDQGWEISVCDMDLTNKGKELFGQDKLVRYFITGFLQLHGTTGHNLEEAHH